MTTVQDGSVTEEIEGLGTGDDGSWGEYPIDTLLIRNENRTIHDVLRRIEQGAFIMNPDFQRPVVWQRDKQSKLIESVLMRIPLPVFYLAEDDEGRMVVVDGLQRLSTFHDFISNNLQLRLPGQTQLNNMWFRDLSPKLQNRIEDCNLILYIIDARVPERARLDIFERVNGGVPLTRQQMRNCLFMGPATRFLRDEANTPLFRQATGESLNSLTMRDREFVNRFCAFYVLPLTDYKDMDEFLAAALKAMNNMPDSKLCELATSFRSGLTNNFEVFGKHAFRKHSIDQDNRSVLNASLWDVMSTGLAIYPEELVKQHAETMRYAFLAMLSDDEFVRSITYSVNDARQVQYRFRFATAMLREVFGDNAV